MIARKKPVIVEAWQFTESDSQKDSFSIPIGWGGVYTFGVYVNGKGERALVIEALGGKVVARPGDWIIRGVRGEFYPCKKEIFEETHELLPDDTPFERPPMGFFEVPPACPTTRNPPQPNE